MGQDRNYHQKSCLLNCWSIYIVFKRYPSTFCLMQGSCFICNQFWNLIFFYLKIRITTFNMMQHCFVNRWATHWFRIDVQVPKEWVGSEVRLRWNSGSEALVWIDGCPKQVKKWVVFYGWDLAIHPVCPISLSKIL